MSKTVQDQKGNAQLSICDIMKGNTSELINKMEMQIPTYTQIFSDLYKEYLHMMDDVYGTCYISEKQFLDKLNIDSNILNFVDNLCKSTIDMYSNQIDIQTNFLRAYAQLRISTIKSYDNYFHIMMESYSKILAQFNSIFEKLQK